MDRIGIVTFWRNNYGSALQAYATKTYIESKGFQADILNERYRGVQRYTNYLKRRFKTILGNLKYKGFYDYNRKNRKKVNNGTSSLSYMSSQCIESFIKRKLFPYETSYSELIKYASDDKTKLILAGSDQVWNCSSGMINPYYFLEFAPKSKRVSFAASFGTSEIPAFLKHDLSEYLSGFKRISVRENEGVKIIEDILHITVKRLADPTLLLSKEEWRAFSAQAYRHNKDFVLIHFIDEPNDIAVEIIGNIRNMCKEDIIVFGYHHEVFDNMIGVINLDGGPEDYVWLIDNAKYVFTDSFHTSLFSINLETNFYVFNRQYKQLLSQNSRIVTLLKLFNYSEHLITENLEIEQLLRIGLHDVSSIINNERKKLKEYLDLELPTISVETERTLKGKETCTGCGACIVTCENNAITMDCDSRGFAFPKVDINNCVNCRQCISVCRKQILNEEQLCFKKAYIAYDANVEQRNKAASGGGFSAIARYWLKKGGVVFGAAMQISDGKATINHIQVTKESDLYKILGSKYVQSSCYESFPIIKQLLKKDVNILFGGTSCQVDALYRYLGDQDISNLMTVDLICHGVPSAKFFQDYLNFISEKCRGTITNFNFRRKIGKSIEYQETIRLRKKNNEVVKYIHSSKSSYYKLFLLGESYRESCYYCSFASLDKPADFTLGDYFEIKHDYPEIAEKILGEDGCGISCMIVHTVQGLELLNELGDGIIKYEVDLPVVQASHPQLCRPIRYSKVREKIFSMYENKGYTAVGRHFYRQDALRAIPRIIKYKILRKK